MIRRLSATFLLLIACTKAPPPDPPAIRPSILLVTLDTTRADAVGPHTPNFNALAARSRQFRYAYATAPQTLPSHASMLTGLYPGGHGVHENGRYLAAHHPLLAERLRAAGYRTGAFVSAFPLARRFGLARGFEVYDDELPPGLSERTAEETTERALAWLRRQSRQPLFLWVHYFDPHYPYEPPEAFHGANPYLGEIAFMDQQLGRVLRAFELQAGPKTIIVAGDHGEGLGDHGEAQHGNLLYQAVMRVPLLVSGPGFAQGITDTPVSIRRIFHTVLDGANLESVNSLRQQDSEIVLGEAMKPFLQYGWQPQVMAVEGHQKVIHAGALEAYDVAADPEEKRDLGRGVNISREVRRAIREYPIPSPAEGAKSQPLDEEARRQLASLGYVTSNARPPIRKDAPRPRDMVGLFDVLDQASGFFVREEYAKAIPLFEKILAGDPHNLGTALQLAAAHSALEHEQQALTAFRKAQAIAPDSSDVRHYLALHYARGRNWQRAIPLLESVVAEEPDRLPALEALATIRERQGRLLDALQLRQRVAVMKTPAAAELIRIGELAMAVGNTALAIDAFEKGRRLQDETFRHHLELGVLYLSARRLHEARESLDRIPPSHPDYAMAVFKRAQVSVLLREPDRASRIALARKHANATTRPLIEKERLFRE